MVTLQTLYNDIKTLGLQMFQEKLVSGDNIKTINNNSILGTGNIAISGTVNNWETITVTTGTLMVNTTLKLAFFTIGQSVNISTANTWQTLTANNIPSAYRLASRVVVSPTNAHPNTDYVQIDTNGTVSVWGGSTGSRTFSCNLLWKYEDVTYQRVEYLQSTGSQYINTGYILQATDKVDVTFSSQGSIQYEAIFGARKGSYSTNAYVVFSRFGSSNKIVYNRSGNEKQGSTISTNTIYDIHTDGTTCTVSQNGSVVQTITTTGTANNTINPCGLFTLNTDSSTGFTKDTYSKMKIYSFKITNANNEVVMNLVPVRVGTTGYMLDTVSNTLMTNVGTFQYGSDI